MKVIRKSDALPEIISLQKKQDKRIGFVPTMGALHQGHTDLLKSALKENDFVVCSIYVNPTQFNDPGDFKNYPVTLSEDLQKLENVGCDLVFIPSDEDMYPSGPRADNIFDPGFAGKTLEAKYRPGHFAGVITIVNRFFNLVSPDNAYFGQKDYQQYLIIKMMTDKCHPGISIVMVPTRRDKNGLALSSRNKHLNTAEKKMATAVFRSLQQIKKLYGTGSLPETVLKEKKKLKSEPGMEVEYFEVRNSANLKPVNDWYDAKKLVACAAVKVNGVRLIDNVLIP